MRTLVVCTLCVWGAGGATAAENPGASRAHHLQEEAYSIPGVRAYTYHSDITGMDYAVTVGVPQSYEQNPARRYSVLLVTDGGEVFPIALSLARSLEGDIDAPVIVGVDAPAAQHSADRRVYEFSPPGWPMKDDFGALIAAGCAASSVRTNPCTGGAPGLLRFLASELLPELVRSYRIDVTDPGLFGHSAGGFFAAWALFQENSPFKRYLIASPALAYGDGEVLRLEQRYAVNHKDLAARIYLSSGMLEIADPFLEGIGRIVSGQARLGAALSGRNYQSLRLHSEIQQGLGHDDSVAAALARGLRLLYSK